VSCNIWWGRLEKKATELQDSAWSLAQEVGWKDDASAKEQYAFCQDQPEGRSEPQLFAFRRWKKGGESFWHHEFLACDAVRGEPRTVFERHRRKIEIERQFVDLLSELNLRDPPCWNLNANRAFYAIAAVAYNLLVALKLMHLPSECQGWRLKTLLRQVVFRPVKVVRPQNRLVLRVHVPASWLRWWQILVG
jgi:hypothetical protein